MNPRVIQQVTANQGQYWRTMAQVSRDLNAWLAAYCQEHPEYAPIMDRYTSKKCHYIGLQCYAGYLASGASSERWYRHVPLAIALELVMLSAYATNQIVDHKKAIWETQGGVERTSLEHGLLMSLLLDLLGMYRKSVSDFSNKTENTVFRMITDLAKGFWVERQELCVRHCSLEVILAHWQQSYYLRNRLIDEVYDFAPLAGYVAGWSQHCLVHCDIEHSFERWFASRLRFSEVMQAVNDLADFLPGACDETVKVYQDRFADIRNGYVTYPVYQLIDTFEMRDALDNPERISDVAWQERILELVAERSVAQELRNQGWQTWSDLAAFWKQWTTPKQRRLLMGTCAILVHNKYFKAALPPAT